MLRWLLFALKCIGGGILSWGAPRALVAAGVPLDRWVVELGLMLGTRISPELALWIATIVIGALLFSAAWWWPRERDAFRSSGRASRAVAKRRIEVKRDVYLYDAIYRIYHGQWGKVGHAALGPNGPERLIKIATVQVRQHAYDGRLPIWGKKFENDIYHSIPQMMWEGYTVDCTRSSPMIARGFRRSRSRVRSSQPPRAAGSG